MDVSWAAWYYINSSLAPGEARNGLSSHSRGLDLVLDRGPTVLVWFAVPFFGAVMATCSWNKGPICPFGLGATPWAHERTSPVTWPCLDDLI